MHPGFEVRRANRANENYRGGGDLRAFDRSVIIIVQSVYAGLRWKGN